MIRLPMTSAVATAVLCGVLFLSLFLFHARVALGENVVRYILTSDETTVTNLWFVLYMLGGVCLLGVVPVTLRAQYGVVTPAVAVVALSAGYLYLANAEVLYLFLLWVPLFVSFVFAVGTVEYLLRAVLVASAGLSDSVATALLFGVPHAIVAVVAAGELSPVPLVSSISTVFVVAVPVLLFLQYNAVGPAVGAITGLTLVLMINWERLPTEYPFVATQALVLIFLFGGIEYALRSTNVVAG